MAEKIKSAIVFFSTGKDSVVILDLCHKFIKNIKVVSLYIVPDLEYKNKLLSIYEKKYKLNIHQFPLPDINNIFIKYSMKKGRKLKQIDIENYIREKFDINYVVYGYKMVDSVNRAGIMNAPYVKDGIDTKNNRLFPLARWSQKEVLYYIKQNKLFLSPEYDYGFRDINEFTKESLNFIKEKFHRDYKKIIDFYPFLKYKEL